VTRFRERRIGPSRSNNRDIFIVFFHLLQILYAFVGLELRADNDGPLFDLKDNHHSSAFDETDARVVVNRHLRVRVHMRLKLTRE